MTIKKSLLVVVLLLNAIIAYFLVSDIVSAVDHQHALVEEKDANIAMTNLLFAAGDWAVERGVTNAALASPSPADSNRVALIKGKREKANLYFESAVLHIDKIVKQMDKEDKIYKLILSEVAEVKKLYDKANSLRNKADNNISVSYSQRDSSVKDNWLPLMTSLIMKSQDLRFSLTEKISKIDPEMGKQAQLKHFAWIMSEYAGRERAIIAGLIANNKVINLKKLSVLSTNRGRVEEAWDLVKKSGNESPEFLKKEIANVDRVFFQGFNPLREKVYASGLKSGVYPVSDKQWISGSSAAIDSILALQSASAKESELHVDKITKKVNDELIIKAILLFITLLFGLSAFYIVLVKVTRPLNEMRDAMNVLANGNTDIDIPAVGRSDEIGEFAESVKVFKENAIERKNIIEKQKESDELAKIEQKEAMDKLADSFERRVQTIISTVSSAATQLMDTSENMASVIEESNKTAQEASKGAVSTSDNVKSVASSVEELSNTVSDISAQIHNSNDLVAKSVQNVESADKHAKALSDASHKVEEVVQLISDIAGQINLLALNATIESARAGDAGKGFAVVASEVKNLAGLTDKSIQEIEVVIAEMNDVSEDIVSALGVIKESVENISESSSGIAVKVEEQSDATNKIASNMRSASQGTQNITKNLETVSSGSEESKSASEQVLSASRELSKQSDILDSEVKDFLAEIRSS